MVAAHRYASRLQEQGLIASIKKIEVRLYGSLAYTGKGHGTDKAVLLGLSGETPADVDLAKIPALLAAIHETNTINILGGHRLPFQPNADLVFDTKTPSPGHPNGMRLTAFDDKGAELLDETYFSIGGGFIMNAGEYEILKNKKLKKAPIGDVPEPFPFHNAVTLLDHCEQQKKSIAEIMMANEMAYRTKAENENGLDKIWKTMSACIDRGISVEGTLPGALKVRRRAKHLFDRAQEASRNVMKNSQLPHQFMDMVSSYAMAVNEENADGGRVVTSPTNGAAGIIPAVIRYYTDHCPGADQNGIRQFLLTAAAFGSIIKRNASISGAEGGCQAEVGSASSMAAAGLCAALGGSNAQIENAAEIALEHHLGMTCDPVGGLVQIPCIERNTMGAVKAINAASLALAGDGRHYVSFDTVVETMRQTGKDMKSKYKETSQGGLAVNVVAC
jgi:L-serine dehydratase